MRLRLLLFVVLVAGCAPAIGDPCSTSTDCSQNGDRLCDVSQQGGYCTVFDCEQGKCPEEATCVLFGASPSSLCMNETGTSPAQRSFCMLTCEDSSDCRTDEGYVCADPSAAGGESIDGAGRQVCLRASTGKPVPDSRSNDVCAADGGAAGPGSDG